MLATPANPAYCLLPTAYCAPHPLAFTFLNWGFFWAGLALPAIPIVIHLLNRRRFRVVTWAAMDFLLEQGCLVRCGRRSYGTSPSLYEDALGVFHHLAEVGT